ncbi:MAG: hypothetical protein JNL81_04065 [Hyphomonadaceae bacterium]|nr:hypothetical protein [Hyphomonadaceae bacterium]
MKERRIARALSRLAQSGASLRALGDGSVYGVFAKRDRRSRPLVRLSAAEVRELEAQGAIEARDGEYGLSAAGAARAAREAAPPQEAFLAQHQSIVARDVIGGDGRVHKVRGIDPDVAMRKLAALRGVGNEPWLSAIELSAAGRLRADWAVGEIGLVRGTDWGAPIGSTPRSASNTQEIAMARRCDARRRVGDALAKLASPLRRVVERVCLYEEGLEALERAEGWPARSGKLALKLGLAQLAAAL